MKSCRINALVILVFLVVLNQLVVAQASGSKLSCDLSYKSVMEENKIDKIDWVRRWFATYNKPPAKKWIGVWKGEPLVSWVLIEHPNFHAAERTTLWLARTKSRAVYWESVQVDYHSVEQIEKRTQRKEIKLDVYDKVFSLASSWKQAETLKPKLPIDDFSPEFWGVATVFDGKECRQLLLGLDDFMSCETKECHKPLKSGKIMKALEPILLEEKTLRKVLFLNRQSFKF